jgi:predicted DNA-binding transcriptional regulator AlpA
MAPPAHKTLSVGSGNCRVGENSRRGFAIQGKVAEYRPPAFVSKRTLARELDCAESTVDELVKRGVLPKPFHLSNGCVRWRWADVETAIASLKEGAAAAGEFDPFLAGVRNATKVD